MNLINDNYNILIRCQKFKRIINILNSLITTNRQRCKYLFNIPVYKMTIKKLLWTFLINYFSY